jgi:hypothetical protein
MPGCRAERGRNPTQRPLRKAFAFKDREERKASHRIVSMGSIFGYFMDLLGPILAYLGSVTAIIAAFAISYEVLIYAQPSSPGSDHAVAMVVKPSSAKPRVATATSRAGKSARSNAALPVVSREAGAKAARQIDAVAQRRAAYHRELARQQRMRWLDRQARARQWTSEHAPAVLGYAEPPAPFGGTPFR